MGYSTYFSGFFELSRKLTVSELETIQTLNDWSGDNPDDAPDGTCDWVIGEYEGKAIVHHNHEEKFREWEDWTRYLAKLFKSWDVKMNGRVVWQGEDTGDCGTVFVKNNEVEFVSIDEMPEPNWGRPWDTDPEFGPEGWQAEVANGETRQGYWEWVRFQREQADG